jgi:hypothetical protein
MRVRACAIVFPIGDSCRRRQPQGRAFAVPELIYFDEGEKIQVDARENSYMEDQPGNERRIAISSFVGTRMEQQKGNAAGSSISPNIWLRAPSGPRPCGDGRQTERRAEGALARIASVSTRAPLCEDLAPRI